MTNSKYKGLKSMFNIIFRPYIYSFIRVKIGQFFFLPQKNLGVENSIFEETKNFPRHENKRCSKRLSIFP